MNRIVALSLTGTLVASYACEDFTLPANPQTAQVKTAAHHIVVVDRSGSMYYEMSEMKTTLEKVFTLQEYENENLLVTLISYSSQGDVTTHFARSPITEIMKTGSAQVEALRRIQATALTCISGGLAAARSQIRAGELTLVTLHSDGYANHPSPSAEIKNLQREAAALSEIPGVVVNAVAHREYSDFNLLNQVASQAGGTAVLAKSAKDVFDTLRGSTKALASGATSTAQVIPGVTGRGKGHVLVIDTAENKVLGGPVEKDLTVRGLSPTARIVRLFEDAVPDVRTVPLHGLTDPQAQMALAYYLLGKKQIGRARDLVRGTRSKALITAHGRAMTSSQVKDLTLACLDATVNPDTYFASTYEAVDFEALGRRAPISEIFSALNRVSRDTLVSMKSVLDGYTRRSLKRIPGSRDKVTGAITLPATKLVRKKDSEFVPFTGIEPNTTTAVMNITVSVPSNLVKFDDGSIIESVAGIDLDNLRDFRSFTVVAEGDVKIPKLVLKFKTKQAHAAMMTYLDGAEPFNPATEYTLDLTNRSLLSAAAADGLDQDELKSATLEMGPLNVLISFLKASLKGGDPSTTYTTEQVEALKAVHMSEKLYHSAPSCTAHPDLDAAVAKGEVDSYNKYSVETGTVGLLTLDRIPSANAFLQRWFSVTDASGAKLEKPTVPDAIAPGATLEVKIPGPRMKVTSVDDLVLPIYKALLLDGDFKVLDTVRGVAGGWVDMLKITRRGDVTGLDVGLVLGQILEALQSYKEELQYRTTIPFAMYVGSTGTLPETWKNVTGPLDAEEFSKMFPEISLAKAEKEDSLFYGLNNGLIVTISAVSERFTTEAGLKAVSQAA